MPPPHQREIVPGTFQPSNVAGVVPERSLKVPESPSTPMSMTRQIIAANRTHLPYKNKDKVSPLIGCDSNFLRPDSFRSFPHTPALSITCCLTKLSCIYAALLCTHVRVYGSHLVYFCGMYRVLRLRIVNSLRIIYLYPKYVSYRKKKHGNFHEQ